MKIHDLAPRLVTPPAEPLLPLEVARAQCNVTGSHDDDLLQAYVTAATTFLDGYSGILGRALVKQTWKQSYSGFSAMLRLSLAPVLKIESLTYLDATGEPQTVDPAHYDLYEDGLGALVYFDQGWHAPQTANKPNAVTITYEAGYGDPEDVPEPIRQAARLLVGHWYESREAVAEGNQNPVPYAVDALIAPYRRVGLAA